MDVREPEESIIPSLVRRVTVAGDAQKALEEIAEALGARWDLWRARIIVFTLEGTARFVANWPALDTLFGDGLEVPLDLTPAVHSIVGDLVRGRTVHVLPDQTDLGLLNELLRLEGVSSGVGVPLRDEHGAVVGLLALSSYRSDAFTPADVASLERIARALEARLVELTVR